MTENRISTKLKGIYAATFGACACYYPFLTYYFQKRGLSFAEIGTIYAASSTMAILTPPIWGIVTDKYLTKRKTLMMTMTLSSVFAINYILAHQFLSILLSVILFQSVLSSIAPVVDALCYENIEQDKRLQYGRVRLVGSICYALASLSCGQIIRHFGGDSAFFAYSMIMLIGVLFVFGMPSGDKGGGTRVRLSDFMQLIRDLRFLLFLAAVFLAGIPIGCDIAYISVLIQKTGGSVAQLGIYGFIVAFSELPSLFFGTRLLKHFGDLKLLMFGLVFYSARYFLDSISIGYGMVLAVQSLQGVSYTFFLMSAYHYLNRIAPAKLRTSSMTFYAAVMGIGGLVGNFNGGILLEHIRIFTLYRMIAVIMLAALGVVAIIRKKEGQTPESLSSTTIL